MDILKEALLMQDELKESLYYIHQNAEIHFELDKTVAHVVKKLKEFGYAPKVIGNNNVTATVGKGDKTLLMRADMDALPIVEDTGLPYASTNGNMHACGHDFNTVILLGAAKLLKEHEHELKGTVKLYFQPAEETISGCKDGIKAGIMENPPVDAAIGIHMSGGERGKDDLSLNKGSWGSCDNYKITIKGQNAHGAGPHAGKNAVVTASHIVIALQNIVPAEIPATGTVTLATCKFEGGTAQNIIPNRAVLHGTIRTQDDELQAKMQKRVPEIVENIAKAFDMEWEFEWTASVPVMKNNHAMIEDVARYAKDLGMNVDVHESYGLASEDFSLITSQVPSVYLQFACFWHFEVSGPGRGGHTPYIVYDVERLHTGVAIFANTAIEWLRENA